ncbi:MAG: aminotransferase class V-fold PLP-dependent enzyme [Pseudomonadales bacterium]|nr:aminotransferase class V-fold PLP-dependent enzyme [Pseudomonadales bacterium]
MRLDIDFIRAQFPAFSEPSLEGWAFFENAGGSYMCQQVIDRLMTYYTQTKVQPYYSYPASTEAGQRMDESYGRLAAYLNIDEDELIFGPSTSQNVYVLAQALHPMWEEGDEIIVSCQNHEANSGAWRRLANQGIVVRDWHIDSKTGRLATDDLDALITPRTRLIAFPHASNVIAHINPVQEISAKAHQAGALVVVDGVSYAPHGLPDIAQLDVDIYLFSLYKTWGPHLGAMYVKRELMKQMVNQSHFYYEHEPHYCLTPAGPDHAQIAAVSGVAEYLDAVYAHHFDDAPDSAVKGRRLHQLFSDYESSLLTPLLDFLKARNDVLIIGPDDPDIREPTVTILPLNKRVPAVVAELEKQKLMVASGDFDVVRILNEMNIDLDPGVIRMSLLHYTTQDEINRLISGLTSALK